MPILTHTFRIFVSSTFEDLKAERNALQRDVWPKLRALCESRGARFQAIDLRWGVRDEAALDQKTMEICLREIRRCQETRIKPNFIVLLGDRYGWLPLPSRIPADELDPRTVAGDWYKLDENAAPAEYVLQPRTGIFTNPDIWGVMEQVLHARLEAAAHAAGITGKELEKYVQSATHQEIVAGLGETEEDQRHVFGFFRERSPQTDPRLDAVKALIPNHIPFPARQAKALCDAVYERLSAVIEEQMRRFRVADPLDTEIEAHDRFAAERARIFQGRQRELAAIQEYFQDDERRPLVLYGPSGSGKSAVVAKASLEYKGSAKVLRRFIAATPDSSSGHALLTSLCREFAREAETPVDFAKLEQAFRDRLAAAAPVVLFVDALDQLATSDPARSLSWLPQELPQGVKVVVSTTAEVGQLPPGLSLAIEPMTVEEGERALGDWLREAEAGRRLQPWQRKKVLDGFGRCHGLPLYLKLAAEESRLWPSYATDADCPIGEGVSGMLTLLFERLAGPAGHGPVLVNRGLGYLAAARYGLTEDEVLEVLTADDFVWEDFDRHKHHDIEGRQLPVVVWSRLRSDLDPYLTERMSPGGTVVAFYHRQLSERAAVGQEPRHQDLARYFKTKPAWLDEGKKHPNARRSAELPYQQRAALDWDAAEATMLDADFLLAKSAAGLALELESDYRQVLAERPGESLRLIHGAVRLSMHVLSKDRKQFASQMVGRLLPYRNTPEIGRFCDGVTAAAPRPWLRPLHPCLDSPGTELVRTLAVDFSGFKSVALTPDGKRVVSASYHKTLNVWDLETGRMLQTLEGHREAVESVAVTHDGKRAISGSSDKTLKVWDLETGRVLQTLEGYDGAGAVAVTPDGKRAVCANLRDYTLKVWDLDTGLALRTLQGHSYIVQDVAVTPDGKKAVSASWDKTLKVWDLETGRLLCTLEGHSAMVAGVAVTPDSEKVVSVSEDKTLKVWDLETGRLLRTLERGEGLVAITPDGKRAISTWDYGHTLKVWDLETGRVLRTIEMHEFVSRVAVTPDGKRVVSASGNTLKVWDLEMPTPTRSLEGHSREVNGLAVTADGKRAVSACDDGTLKVWDLETGQVLRTLEGLCGLLHGDHGVAVTPDGKRAVSASWDKTLKVCDLDTGRSLHTLKGHHDQVSSVAVTPDGERAVSTSWDKTLKVWDLYNGRALYTLEGHAQRVNGVAITPDGKRAVSASSDTTLQVWDLETGCALRTLGRRTRGYQADRDVESLAIMPDGKRIIFASPHKTLKVLDLETGRTLQTLKGHHDDVSSVAVTCDGKRAVSASRDLTLRVWDLETAQTIVTFHCDAEARCCAFADSQRIVAGDDAGHVYFLSLEEPLHWRSV